MVNKLLAKIYPKEEQKIFSGRSSYLEYLEKHVSLLKKSQPKNIALVGKRFIGKSFLVKEFIRRLDKNIVPVYLDLEQMPLTPEEFSVAFVAKVLEWHLKKEVGYDIDSLLNIANSLDKSCSDVIHSLHNELLKIKPNQTLMIETAFSFPEILSSSAGKKIVICIKEFQELLALNNFPQIKDIIGLFDSFKNKNAMYLVTGNATKLLKKSLVDFEVREITELSEEETKKLVEKEGVRYQKKIFELTKGHPYYVLSLCARLKQTTNVEKAFVVETLTREGKIYCACEKILDESLARARGQTLLRSLLIALSKQKGIRLSDLARKIYRSAPVTKSLVERLVDVDLVVKADSKYRISDPVLRYFIEKKFSGLVFGIIPEETLQKLAEEVDV